MRITKTVFILGVLSAILSTSYSHAENLHMVTLALQKTVNEANQKGMIDPINQLLSDYQALNNNIVMRVDDKLIDSRDNNYALVHTKSLIKPKYLPRKIWKAFTNLLDQPLADYYSGGGLTIDFINFDNQGYHDVLIRIPNMGSAGGENYLFYSFNPTSNTFIPLLSDENVLLIGQKGDTSDLFFIQLNHKNYAVYKSDNTFALADRATLKKIAEGKTVEGLALEYNYDYKVSKVLNYKEALDVLGFSSFTEAELNIKQVIPQINRVLNLSGQVEDKDCPLTDDGALSAYVDSWSFSFKFQHQCYYNVMTCALEDALDTCDLEVYPDNQLNRKLFQVKKTRYLKSTSLVNFSH